MILCAGLALLASAGTVLAHAYPKTNDPAANARLDGSPAHIAIIYDSAIDVRGSSMMTTTSRGPGTYGTLDKVPGSQGEAPGLLSIVRLTGAPG